MLIRFRVENHRSIHDEQELSLVASSLSEHAESLVRAERYDLDLLRVAAVYGANASGKSTLFDALAFMKTAVARSHRSWNPARGIPRYPFALDFDAQDEPSRFSVDLLLNGVRYEYGFSLDSYRILEEWLNAYPKGRRQEWFSRDAGRESEFEFSRLLVGEHRLIASLTRPNSLFLSAAAQNNHEMLSPLYKWFSQQFGAIDDHSRLSLFRRTAEKCIDTAFRGSVFSLLEAADLGVTSLEVIEDPQLSLFESRPGERVKGVQLRHRTGLGLPDIALPFHMESRGTRALFSMAGLVVDVLSSGGTLLVDELDRSLHPHLAIQIVEIFSHPATNPLNAQLIFNTHDTNLLDTSILRRDQIWFTEKGDDGATRLFPLTDFRARKYENLERGYLQGRYGAVPTIRTPDLRLAAEG